MSVLTMIGISHPGMVRELNEDAYLVKPELGLAVLADGMGGHQAGEVASAMAVDLISRYLEAALADLPEAVTPEDELLPVMVAVHEAIAEANAKVYQAAQSKPEFAGMGTTVVVMVFHGNKFCVGHVGDSRVYRYRRGQLTQVTEDHSMVQELLKRGLITPDEARTSSNRNLVTRALGVEPVVQSEVGEHEFQADDIFLLCSDGLNDVLSDAEIRQALATHGQNLSRAVENMVLDVNARGGPDNVSIVLVRTGKSFVRPKPASRKSRG